MMQIVDIPKTEAFTLVLPHFSKKLPQAVPATVCECRLLNGGLVVQVVTGEDQVAVGDLGVPVQQILHRAVEADSQAAQGVAALDLIDFKAFLVLRALVAAGREVQVFQVQFDGFHVFEIGHCDFLLAA